jgi:homoserine kinase type II
MDTSAMLHLEELNPSRSLLENSEKIKEIVTTLHESIDLAFLRNKIKEIVETYYDLGEVVEVYEIFGGYINRSFGIYVEKNGERYEYFVRKYKKGITEKEILFEHSLINYSVEHGLEMAAGVIHARDGMTYVKLTEEVDGKICVDYYAIYEYLSGEDKYAWDDNIMTDGEYASAAEVLATFHNAAKDFDPKGLERAEPKIMDFLPTLPKLYKEFAKLEFNNKFHKYYVKNLDRILEVIEISQIPQAEIRKMPLVPIHCDFHPGNLKFKDNKAVGIFDFDWSKIDLRLFDVCLALAYCCSPWEDEKDGTLLLDKCEIFLKSYQNKLKELGGLETFNETEKKYFPTMMAAANIYLINWDVTAYYDNPTLNIYEQKTYLVHNVKLMNWIENHKNDLALLVNSI